ncbi:MAG TPA: ACP S-malonyltransferase [Casimicrobiaceae bacterium]|jgi:[acyl-carrier-protein] S-malonyltransferase|nr:ACP S-malonyltransferase [Casimicrobiaceae bacterium]
MKLALVFPGQGSQSAGMMSRYSSYPVVRDTFAEASAALGQDLWALVEAGDDALNQTVNTQPVMLAADIAVYRAWRAAGGGAPTLLAGHSLGEYAALVAGGALAFADALPLVRFRAQAMQEAVPEGVGAMAAIMGLDEAGVADACREAAQGQVVEAVNFNAPDQIVIAGHREAVERAVAAAKARGAKRAIMLPVSAPFHCQLMRPAAERLAGYLANVAVDPPAVPVMHNVDAREAETADAIRAALSAQAASPVRWVETVRAFVAQDITHIVECGPGKVLTGLTKRIAPDVAALPLNDGDAIAAAIAETAQEGG